MLEAAKSGSGADGEAAESQQKAWEAEEATMRAELQAQSEEVLWGCSLSCGGLPGACVHVLSLVDKGSKSTFLVNLKLQFFPPLSTDGPNEPSLVDLGSNCALSHRLGGKMRPLLSP